MEKQYTKLGQNEIRVTTEHKFSTEELAEKMRHLVVNRDVALSRIETIQADVTVYDKEIESIENILK